MKEPYTTTLRVIGDKLTMDEVAEYVRTEWVPMNGFQIEGCGQNCFKLIFKDNEDYKKSVAEEWIWIKTNLSYIRAPLQKNT